MSDWVDKLVKKAHQICKAWNIAREGHRDCTKDAMTRTVYDDDGKSLWSQVIETDEICDCHAYFGREIAQLGRQLDAINDELDRAARKVENRVTHDSKHGWMRR